MKMERNGRTMRIATKMKIWPSHDLLSNLLAFLGVRGLKNIRVAVRVFTPCELA
jgi:hypothetical protein